MLDKASFVVQRETSGMSPRAVGEEPRTMKWIYWNIVLAGLLAVLMPITAVAGCGNVFGKDAPAVFKEQSSWSPAEKAVAAGHYRRAIRELRSTMGALRLIRNRFIRHCVASGADARLATAQAGLAYLDAHPDDKSGAHKAEHHAWVTFPMSHNCP